MQAIVKTTTYSESAKGVTVTKARAIRELAKHGADTSEFFAEVGERETYQAEEVMNWLGY
jgi:hypothetical protein